MRTRDSICRRYLPFVAKIHQIVKEHSEQGRLILVAGDETHPEVKGIVGFCRLGAVVFKCADELQEITEKIRNGQNGLRFWWRKLLLTSKNGENLHFREKVYTNLIIFDTICNATEMRQQEAIVLAKESDSMVVIGGKNSSNTMKLAEICSQYCQTFHIEKASELPQFDLSTSSVIGVTAGASDSGLHN